MPAIYLNNSNKTLSKRFACLQNKCFRHVIPFLLNSRLKRTNIWIGSSISKGLSPGLDREHKNL